MFQRFAFIMMSVSFLAALTSCGPILNEKAPSRSSAAAETSLATIQSLANESDAYAIGLTSGVSGLGLSCKATNPKSGCNSANQIQVAWNGCSTDKGAVLDGGWINTYNDTTACMNSQGPLQNGDWVTRTSGGMKISNVYDGDLYWDTNVHRTYNNVTIPSGLTVSQNGDLRTITISGAHRVLQGRYGAAFDHSITTPTSLTVTGAIRNGTRRVISGTVRVYDNGNKYFVDNSFSNVRWSQNTCCYPTSGSITSTFSDGASSAYNVMTFTSSCGFASMQDDQGRVSSVQLRQCE